MAKFHTQPIAMNFELTKQCPLHCPQCYVADLHDDRELPLGLTKFRLNDAARSGITHVNLSGGETLAYSHLEELIAECARLKLTSAIALSGAYVTRERLISIINAGVTMIFVSLNGSTEEINRRTRDGFSLAIRTLELLRELQFAETYINWVMHESNADDLPGMLELAREFHVKAIVIMAFKPDSAHELVDYPTRDQLLKTAQFVKAHGDSEPRLLVETCFSQLRAVIGHGFFINQNRGIDRGCGAGRNSINVDIAGRFTPCRHLDLPEDFQSVTEYRTHSKILSALRALEDRIDAPCSECKYLQGCLPCAAINVKLRQKIAFGMPDCPLENS